MRRMLRQVVSAAFEALRRPHLVDKILYWSISIARCARGKVGDQNTTCTPSTLLTTGSASDTQSIPTDEGMVQSSDIHRLPGLRRTDPVRRHCRRTIEPRQRCRQL